MSRDNTTLIKTSASRRARHSSRMDLTDLGPTMMMVPAHSMMMSSSNTIRGLYGLGSMVNET
eukprot:scaffold5233_cov178-Amphora_coffeaeformis.AAC.6